MNASLEVFAQAIPSASAPGFTAFWFGVLALAVGLAIFIWIRMHDDTYLLYAIYVGAVGLMSLNNHGLADWWRGQVGEEAFVSLNNFWHLPYAIFYLFFVRRYFDVREWMPGWTLFFRWLLLAYAATGLWWAMDGLWTGVHGSEWAILLCNIINLLASLVLGVLATQRHRPGAREFLFASVPLAFSGLVLVNRFLVDPATNAGAALTAFRTGFILHVMIFLLAMNVRHRAQRHHAAWRP